MEDNENIDLPTPDLLKRYSSSTANTNPRGGKDPHLESSDIEEEEVSDKRAQMMKNCK